jgi:hypothetical protein
VKFTWLEGNRRSGARFVSQKRAKGDIGIGLKSLTAEKKSTMTYIYTLSGRCHFTIFSSELKCLSLCLLGLFDAILKR